MKDPIVEEVRKSRSEHSGLFDNNLDLICEDLKVLQRSCGHRVIRLKPKKLHNKSQMKSRSQLLGLLGGR